MRVGIDMTITRFAPTGESVYAANLWGAPPPSVGAIAWAGRPRRCRRAPRSS